MKAELRIISNIPPEYMELSDALSELMYACGSKILCGACFEGKLHAQVYELRREGNTIASRGCCGSCKNLTIRGCIQKPVGCAGFVCEGLSQLIPERVFKTAKRVQNSAFYSQVGGYVHGNGYYNWTIEDVLQQSYTPAQLARFRTATARIQKITRWVERNFKPNWPLVARFTKADEGVLG